ncbi:MAG: SUMF1/EgtB/PvdO family nonheme iron enzyme [Pseudomonadota bacterium]
MTSRAAGLMIGWLLSLPIVAQTFTDCDDCPEMVMVPSGQAQLGAEPFEVNVKRGDLPLRTVTISYRLAVAKTETTQAQYRAFMESSGHQMSDQGCNTWNVNRIMGYVRAHSWENPGYPQNDNHPVVCVSHGDATAYAQWLAQTTGKPYRLLSSTEFEYALRAGTRGPWFWGADNAAACTFANVGDSNFRRRFDYGPVFNCDDGYLQTAPVASFEANPWGLHDMLGNAWEWTDDCVHSESREIPLDGRAWLAEDGGDCSRRTPRGGSWVSGTDWVRAAAQAADGATYHSQILGFRVGLTLEE